MKKILIVMPNKLPVPPVKGGAVETLIFDGFIKTNEINHLADFKVISIFDEKAKNESLSFKNTEYVYFKNSFISKLLDKALSFFLKVLKSENVKSYGYIFRTLSYSRQIKNYLKKNDYFDAIICENSIPILRVFKNKKTERLLAKTHYHSHSFPGRLFGTKSILSSINSIISVSDYITRKFEALLPETHSKKETLFNVVDTRKFAPSLSQRAEGRKRLGLAETDFVVMFAGRISREKGIQYLLEAAKTFAGRPNIRLLIVGSNFYKTDVVSPFQKELICLSESFKEKVVFTGYVSHESMPMYYNLADVVVLPSNWNDPCPLTVFEAMSCGVPLITTNDGGIPEIVGDTGFVIDKQTDISSQIAETVLMLEENPEKRKEASFNERKRALNFDVNNYLTTLLDLL